jgi:DNA-binding transcriptional regulator YhcF (GntR family)
MTRGEERVLDYLKGRVKFVSSREVAMHFVLGEAYVARLFRSLYDQGFLEMKKDQNKKLYRLRGEE